MHTEEQARELWCPHVRYAIEGSKWRIAINRWLGMSDRNFNPEPAHCIASQCMAWRWADGVDPRNPKHPEGVRPYGYCGLAGYPDAMKIMPRSDVI